MCILNTNQATHIDHSGSRFIIDPSFSIQNIFRILDTYVHTDPFYSDHCTIIQHFGYSTSCHLQTSINWEAIVLLNRGLDN